MEGSCKNRIFIVTFLSAIVFSLILLNGCATGKRSSATSPINVKGKKEILVARDIGRGGDVYPPDWCGNNALLYTGEEIGVELIDLVTKKRTQISEYQFDTPLNCSPDGKWVLYHESDAVKVEKDWDASWEEHLKENWPDGVFTYYIYRYEVETGKREKVAAGSDTDEGGWYEALSPDGKKILLGTKNSLDADIYVPEWEPVWFSNDWWGRWGTMWFSDSSGVVQYRNNPNEVCVEFFGEDGWAKCFQVESKYEGNIFGLLLDKENRIYFQMSFGLGGTHFVHRCDIKGRKLVCEQVLEHIRHGGHFAFLPGGDLIYQYDDECIMRADPWMANGECVVDARRYGPEYFAINLIGVSPDGRWLAFEKRRDELRVRGRWYVRPKDLFVIDLKND